MPTKEWRQDVSACLVLVKFRVFQFHHAMFCDALGQENIMPEMALFDLEEAMENLREAYDAIRKS